MNQKKKNLLRDILAIGALAFLGSKIEQEEEKNHELEEERDELQSKLDAIKEKYGIEDDDEFMDGMDFDES